MNHTVCSRSLDVASHSYQLMLGTLPKSKFPNASQGICKQDFQRIAVLLCSFFSAQPNIHNLAENVAEK